MNLKDIMGINSTEIQELFLQIEKASANIDGKITDKKLILPNDEFLNNNEVCKLLCVSPRTLQDYRDKRIIPFYKIEGKILYKMSDIRKTLERHYYDAWKRKTNLY